MDILNGMAEETVVFQVGNSLAIRLIGDCKLPRGMRVRETRKGNRIILEPITDTWPQAFLDAAGVLKEDLPRPRDEKPPRDPFAFLDA
jgi:virulence-associated protein VagC